MSMHRIPLTEVEEYGLRAHGLDIGTPSQLSDAFRQGLKYGQLDSNSEIAELRSANAELERQLEEAKSESRDACIGLNDYFGKQLAESQAREARMLKFIDEVAKQTPEKPDYWSSCSQCERNSSEAEDFIALPPDDTALKEYRDAVIEECAKFCDNLENGNRDYLEGAALCSAEIRKLKANP